jgi:hypothetical protein
MTKIYLKIIKEPINNEASVQSFDTEYNLNDMKAISREKIKLANVGLLKKAITDLLCHFDSIDENKNKQAKRVIGTKIAL